MNDNKKKRYYKGVKINALGLPILFKNENSRIKKQNRKRNYYGVCFPSPFKNDSPKNLILMYDIPHFQKKERDWLRRGLIRFGYVMIQKSVWAGPSPLPKEFLKYLSDIKIKDNLKTFKLEKPYDTKKNTL